MEVLFIFDQTCVHLCADRYALRKCSHIGRSSIELFTKGCRQNAVRDIKELQHEHKHMRTERKGEKKKSQKSLQEMLNPCFNGFGILVRVGTTHSKKTIHMIIGDLLGRKVQTKNALGCILLYVTALREASAKGRTGTRDQRHYLVWMDLES